MIVVDASVVIPALLDDERDGNAARARLRGERLAAPHLIDLEVTSAMRRLAAAEQVDERRCQIALSDLADLRVDRAPHLPLLPRAWELRDNLTIYDAIYVSLAEALDSVLLTADQRLARAPGVRAEVEVIS